MKTKQTKEQQAQEYAEKKTVAAFDYISPNIDTTENLKIPVFTGEQIKQAYLDGYTDCEQSQWRSVEEELPEEERLVLAAFKTDGYRTARMAIYSHDYERWISFPGTCTLSNVDFWMPIPPIPDTNTDKK